MALAPGTYAFECTECEGEGQIEVGDYDYGDHDWVQCDHCHGAGELLVDEDEAAEMVDDGLEPLRGPTDE